MVLILCGCNATDSTNESKVFYSLCEAKTIFNTKIVRADDLASAPEMPTTGEFQLVSYKSPAGSMAAYLTVDPKDFKRHPAIIWITGGDCNSIGDVWSRQSRSNDQSAAAYRDVGIVMMFPSLRGGNSNPGQREGFFGEVDDVLAAADYLQTLPYVDSNQIYLGGHSTGGTLAMLAAACPNRFQAVFAVGPVARADHYGGEFIYCDPNDEIEVGYRSPIVWLTCIKTPTYVFEGAVEGNWESIQSMADKNKNPNVQFIKVPNHNHFSLLAPLNELIARNINFGQIRISPSDVEDLH